jgi:hypothetical protein
LLEHRVLTVRVADPLHMKLFFHGIVRAPHR